jgi:hypothetical protein
VPRNDSALAGITSGTSVDAAHASQPKVLMSQLPEPTWRSITPAMPVLKLMRDPRRVTTALPDAVQRLRWKPLPEGSRQAAC